MKKKKKIPLYMLEIILPTKYNKLAFESNEIFKWLEENLSKMQIKKVKRYIDLDRQTRKMFQNEKEKRM